jgi:hypothetical protein
MKKTVHMEKFTLNSALQSDFLKYSGIILLIMIFVSESLFANGGVGYKGIYINNKGTKTWYKAHNVAWGFNGCGNFQFNAASDFSGQNFGSFTTTETLQIAGFAVIGWTDNSDWVAGKLLYKVWKQNDSEPGTWTEISIGNYGNGNGATQVVCSSANDRVVGYDNGSISINPGAPGTYNLKIQALGRMQWSGGNFNTNDGAEVTATFTVTSSATDNFRSRATGNWNTAGSWESSSNGTSWGISTLVPGSSASALTIQNGHNITLDANVTVPGLTINTGATFTASDVSARTLTISKSTSGSSTTLSNSGTWSNGTGGSTVVFSGAPSSGDAVHAISGTIAFQNLTVNKTGGTSNVGASFSANSSLTGTLEIGAGGYISTNPPSAFYGSGAILKFNQGEGATYDVNTGDRTWSTTEIPQNITVTSGKVRVNENRTATGSLIISSGAQLEISAGKQVSIATGFNNSGTLTLKSDATGAVATITTPSSITNSGATYNVEQYLTTGRNWYVSSPVSGATTAVLNASVAKPVYSYNETTGTSAPWTTISNTTTGLTILKGYITNQASSGVVTFTGGNLNAGTKEIALTRTSGQTKEGFNLVGNPFPAHLNWTSTLASAANASTSIWYRTKPSSYAFHTYNASGGIGTPLGVTGKIPPMQAFWVRANAGGGTLSVNNTTNCTHESSNPLKAPAVNQPILRMQISNGTNADEAILYFNENAANEFDSYDSEKMFSNTASIPEIYTTVGTEELVINGMNSYSYSTSVPLGFNAGETNTYTISASQIQNFDSDTRIILVDNSTSTQTDLTAGESYTFTSDATNSTTRFNVLFKSASGTTEVKNEKVSLIIYPVDHKIMIDINQLIGQNASVVVYNSLGQRLHSQKIASNKIILNKNFESGIYFIYLQLGNEKVTEKVIVK